MDLWTMISTLISILGLIGTVYFGMKSKGLEGKISRYTWKDIEDGVRFLHNNIYKKFKPDLILSSSAGSDGIVTHLFWTNLNDFIPVFIGISKKIGEEFSCDPGYEKYFETSRWQTYIPNEVFVNTDKRVLILEDVVLSGDTLFNMIELLLNNGYKRENILTAALFVTKRAEKINRKSDVYWRMLPDENFYFPWGNSMGKGYQ